MGFRQIIARFFAVERQVKQLLPISAVAPLTVTQTKNGTIIRDTRTTGYAEDFDGWISATGPNGEKDYTDARYYVHKGLPQPGIADTDNFAFSMMPPSTDDKGASLKDDIVTVTNEPEMPYNAAENVTPGTGSHTLKVGQQVRVRAAYASDGTRHYVMNEGGVSLSYIKLTANWSTTTANLVLGNPSDDAGNVAGTNVLKIALAAPISSGSASGNASQLATGDVVPYLPISPKVNQGTNTMDGIAMPTTRATNATIGTLQYQVYQMLTPTVAGWTYPMIHP